MLAMSKAKHEPTRLTPEPVSRRLRLSDQEEAKEEVEEMKKQPKNFAQNSSTRKETGEYILWMHCTPDNGAVTMYMSEKNIPDTTIFASSYAVKFNEILNGANKNKGKGKGERQRIKPSR